jgi:Listeria-Bacteroides repeat domain (List_Bact_rpt).
MKRSKCGDDAARGGNDGVGRKNRSDYGLLGKKRNKAFIFLAVVMMVAVSLSAVVLQDEEEVSGGLISSLGADQYSVGNIVYEVVSDTAPLTAKVVGYESGLAAGASVTIGPTVNMNSTTYNVVEIASDAFTGRKAISVTVNADNMSTIASGTFGSLTAGNITINNNTGASALTIAGGAISGTMGTLTINNASTGAITVGSNAVSSGATLGALAFGAGTGPINLSGSAFSGANVGGALSVPNNVAIGTGLNGIQLAGALSFAGTGKAIPDNAFGAAKFGSVNLANVVSVGANAFSGLTTATTISNVNGLTAIGNNAFNSTNITIAGPLTLSGVTQLGSGAFSGATINGSVSITGSSGLGIGDSAFANTKFSAGAVVTIGSNVASIGNSAFANSTAGNAFTLVTTGATSLTTIGNNAFNNVNLGGTLTIPTTVATIGSGAFANTNFTGNLVIPNSVTTLGSAAFQNSNFNGSLTFTPTGGAPTASIAITDQFSGVPFGTSGTQNLAISNNVSSISSTAFNSSVFKGTLTFEDGTPITSIGTEFSAQQFTGALRIPATVKTIDPTAFASSNFTSLTFESTSQLEEINEAFSSLALTGSLVIPASVKSIADGAFAGSNFTGTLTFEAPATSLLESIGANAFKNQHFTGSLLLPTALKEIGDGAFEITSGTSFSGGTLTLGRDLSKIGDNAFKGTGFTGDLEMKENVTAIGDSAFEGVPFSGELIMAKNVTSVGEKAFYNTTFSGGKLNLSNVKTVGADAFNGPKFIGDLYMPKATSIGANAFYDAGFTGSLTLGNGLSAIQDGTFYKTGFYGNLYIPSSVTSIGESAFEGTTNLNGTLYLNGPNLNSIGVDAFKDSGISDELTIPSSVVTIGNGAFQNTRVSFLFFEGNGLRTIGDDAFNGTTIVGGLTLPDTVETIGDRAFYDTQLTLELHLGESLISIGESAFENARFAGELVLPDTLVAIGDNAFKGTSRFSGQLIIPENVTTIGAGAFENTNFTGSLMIGESVTSIGSKAFDDDFSEIYFLVAKVPPTDGYANGNWDFADTLPTMASDAFGGFGQSGVTFYRYGYIGSGLTVPGAWWGSYITAAQQGVYFHMTLSNQGTNIYDIVFPVPVTADRAEEVLGKIPRPADKPNAGPAINDGGSFIPLAGYEPNRQDEFEVWAIGWAVTVIMNPGTKYGGNSAEILRKDGWGNIPYVNKSEFSLDLAPFYDSNTGGDVRTFLGWNTDPNGYGQFYRDGQSLSSILFPSNGVLELYAIWTLGGGGGGMLPPLTYHDDAGTPLFAVDLDYTNNGPSGMPTIPSHRVWDGASIKTYNLSVQSPWTGGSFVTVPIAPKADYRFMGWSTIPGGDLVFDITSNVEPADVLTWYRSTPNAINLYPVWEQYTVTYMPNTAEIGNPYEDMGNGADYTYLDDATLGFTKDGWYLLGWSTDLYDKTPMYLAGDMTDIKADTLLYAIWGRNTVTYAGSDGYVDNLVSNVTAGGYSGTGYLVADLISSPNTQYVVDSGDPSVAYIIDTTNGDVLATFNGIPQLANAMFDGTNYIVPNLASASGFTMTIGSDVYYFEGWYFDNGSALEYRASETTFTFAGPNSHVTMIAIWNTYTLTLDVDGGRDIYKKGDPAYMDNTIYGVGAVELPSGKGFDASGQGSKIFEPILRTGYNLIGWEDTVNNAKYYLDNLVYNLNSNITLVAIWEPIDITYYDNRGSLSQGTEVSVTDEGVNIIIANDDRTILSADDLNAILATGGATNNKDLFILEGYKIAGWTIESMKGHKIFDFGSNKDYWFDPGMDISQAGYMGAFVDGDWEYDLLAGNVSLYAIWVPVGITYMDGATTVAVDDQATSYDSRTINNGLSISKQGYYLAGWEDTTGTLFFEPGVSVEGWNIQMTEDFELFAVWEPLKVTYLNTYDGTEVEYAAGDDYINDVIPAAAAFTLDGYNLVGWTRFESSIFGGTPIFTGVPGTDILAPAASMPALASNVKTITLYPVWNAWTITYDDNNGTLGPSAIVDQGKVWPKVITSEIPVYAPNEFLGWTFIADDRTGVIFRAGNQLDLSMLTSAQISAQSVTLYALWEAKVGINYHANKFDGDTENRIMSSSFVQDPGFINQGYVFVGWSTTPTNWAGNETSVVPYGDMSLVDYVNGVLLDAADVPATPGDNCDLYAIWRTANLVYDANGGIGLPNNTDYDAPYDKTVRSGSGYSNTGYKFVGWISEFGVEYKPGDKIAVTDMPQSGRDLRLVAQWEIIIPPGGGVPPVNVTLTINVYGGPASVQYDLGGGYINYQNTVTLTPGVNVMVKATVGNGYVIDYWSGNAGGSSSVLTLYSVTAPITLDLYIKADDGNGGGDDGNGGGGGDDGKDGDGGKDGNNGGIFGGDWNVPWWLIPLLIGLFLLFLLLLLLLAIRKTEFEVITSSGSANVIGSDRAKKKKPYTFMVEGGAGNNVVRYRVGDGDWENLVANSDGVFEVPGDEVVDDMFIRVE